MSARRLASPHLLVGSAEHQTLLRHLPDDDACTICYGVRYHPCGVSAECSHQFCRSCAFKCLKVSASCPLCRAPCNPATAGALLPSEIAFDVEADASLADAHPRLHECAERAEAEVEAQLRKSVIPSVPLVMLPGECARDSFGKPIRIKVNAKMTFYFSETDALETLESSLHRGDRVGFLFRESSVHGGQSRGFLAHPVKCSVPVSTARSTDSVMYKAKVATFFRLVGFPKRDSTTGKLVGAVEVQ